MRLEFSSNLSVTEALLNILCMTFFVTSSVVVLEAPTQVKSVYDKIVIENQKKKRLRSQILFTSVSI